MKRIISNWGFFPFKECHIVEPNDYEGVKKAILDNYQVIARGNGRCYGDASLSSNVISSLKLNKIIELDEDKGILICQSGVLLSDVLSYIIPKGFFLPVSPGTKFITVGGAFASDVHGKNHHVEGVFSDHVLELKLMNQTGEILVLKSGEELFNHTAGGMGLTGFILELSFFLKKIETSYIKQTAIRGKNLSEIFNLFENNKHCTYSVAWIDCLSNGKNLGRSVLLLGEHAINSEVPKEKNRFKVHKKPSFNIPFFFPSWFLNSFFIKMFNHFFYYKPSSNVSNSIIHYDPYFFPLDSVNNWNRIYGKKGFIQYQFVIPKEYSFEAVSKILNIFSTNNLGSFLAVLKLFGKSHSNRFFHFPVEGYTLAVDIKITNKIWDILNDIDDIVTNFNGKIYLTKDARMSNLAFNSQYPIKVPANDKFISHQRIRLNQSNNCVFLILGANSDIAKSTALEFIKNFPCGKLIMAVRDIEAMNIWLDSNKMTNQSSVVYFDVNTSSSDKFVKDLADKPKWIMYAAGVLYNNEECSKDLKKLEDNFYVNYFGAVKVLNALINDNNPFLERIIGMSSIAGLRGRMSNYLYGSAKSGFHQYLFGLRQDLRKRNILVQAITPGIVKTKMTSHLNESTISVDAKVVAKSIFNGSSNFEIYPNLVWKIISLIVKWAPEILIKKI
jgi:decaprenylphospho-beta-D-ribofuranose 2-oxidase